MATNRELLFANNALTTLAGSISNTSVTANLAAGTGILFQPPGAGQGFYGTFTDAATGLIREIVLVTNVTGDTITMIRGQDGTSAVGWAANDLFGQLVTAGDMDAMVQIPQLQEQAGNYAVDIGSANAYLAAFDPAIASAPSAGTPLRVKWANANTTASTLNAGWGVVPIKRRDGSALIGNEILAGNIDELFFDGTNLLLDYIAPATTAAVATGTDTQSAVTPAQLSAALGTGKLLSGQCYLQYTSTTSIKLAPYNGNNIPVAGNIVQIAAAGVSIANTNVTVNGVGAQNLATSSAYLVAIGAGGALEYWSLATGHSVDTTAGNIGVEVITGHATKTLVGAVVTNPSSQFSLVLTASWFNRKAKINPTTLSGNQTLNTVTITEINSSIRNSFFVWSGDSIKFDISGSVRPSTGSHVGVTSIAFDGTTPEISGDAYEAFGGGSSTVGGVTFGGLKSGLSEGLHYATLVGSTPVDGGGTGTATWVGGNTAITGTSYPPCQLTVTVSG